MQGTRVGSFTLVAQLGSGGMGTVWRAQGDDGTTVAVKVVHPHLVEQPGFRERFDREARSGLRITSPCVVRTIACAECVADGRSVPALVLEFVEGRDLAALLAETGTVPEDLCRHLGREIARGLDAIHSASIVHRDLKPGNVILTPTGDVKVMDLGLARQASGDDRMSQTGLFLGTAAYAPPEQFFGKKDLDPRSDLYSLGAMLFELATGRVPFEAEGIGDLVRKVLRDRAPRLGSLAPQTTPFFEALVATLLEKEPDRRFASAAELVEVLDAGESGDWWAAASMRLQMETHRPLRRVRVQRETALWGRDEDLAELRGLWDRARGGRGAVALVEGEPGIGKTRLVEEFLAEIEASGEAQVVAARHEVAAAGSVADALAAAFRDHLGAEDLDARLADLVTDTPDLVPAFAALLRGEPSPPGAAPLTPPAVRTLFAALVRGLSAESPLVVLVDDLHFASDESRAQFASIAHAIEDAPVLLVGTARPVLPAAWTEQIARREHVTRHTVQRLGEADLRTAIAAHLGSTWEADVVAEKVAAQAGGNPYFVVEALRHLGESGHLARAADGAWRVTAVPAQLALPKTVRELVAARFAALAPADREIVEAAACQGQEFDGRLVAETIGRQRVDVLRALGRIEHATRLVRAAGTKFAFDHHVVHDVAYTTQGADARRVRHAAIGTAIEARHGGPSRPASEIDDGACAAIAEHLLLGGEPQRALTRLDRGLAHHERRFRNAAMLRLADLALDVPGLVTGAERATILLRIADGALSRLGLRARYESVVREAVALAEASGDGELLARALSVAAWTHLMSGRPDDAAIEFRRVLGIATATDSPRSRAGAENGLGNACYIARRLDEAAAHYGAALELSRAAGDVRGQAGSTINLGNVLLDQGRAAEAYDAQLRGIALARECGFRPFESNGVGNLAGAAVALGRIDEGRRHYEAHAALLREMGDRAGEAVVCSNVGGLLRQSGRIDDAIASLRRAVAIARQVGDRLSELPATFNLAYSLYWRGDDGEARTLLEHVLAELVGPGGALWAAQSEFLLGDLRLRSGELDRAARHFEAARGHAPAANAPNMDILSLCRLACVARAASRDASEIASLVASATEWLAARGGELTAPHRALARLYLWEATGDRAHLAAARPDHDAALAAIPEENRALAVRTIRSFRETDAALTAAGL